MILKKNGPSNNIHLAKKVTFGTFLALDDPILTGLGTFLDTVLLIYIQ